MKKKLYRGKDKVLGGVLSGIDDYFNWPLDPNIVRILFVLLVLAGFGAGIIVYIVAWFIMPDQPDKEMG